MGQGIFPSLTIYVVHLSYYKQELFLSSFFLWGRDLNPSPTRKQLDVLRVMLLSRIHNHVLYTKVAVFGINVRIINIFNFQREADIRIDQALDVT